MTSKRLISVFVSGVILLQFHVLAVFLPRDRFPNLQRIAPPRLWPFIDYPMFSRPRNEGDVIPEYHVFGIFEDSTEAQIGPAELGVGHWHFTSFVSALGEDGNVAILREFVNLYEKQTGRKLSSLRMENHPWIFWADGLTRGSVEVVATKHLDRLRRKP